MRERPRLVVVGNGMVGQYFVEQAVTAGLNQRYQMVVIGDEPRPAYDRVRLSEYFADASLDDLSLTTAAYFEAHQITLLLRRRVIEICPDHSELKLDNQTSLGFDRLVLATGSYPFVPPIQGADGDHCFVYRTIEDLDAIIADASSGATSGVVIGGGLLGLEAANALKNLGLEAHVIQFASTLMEMQLDPAGGRVLQKKIEALGVHVHTARNTQSIGPGQTHRLRLEFVDHAPLETDLVVISTGVRPCDNLASAGGLAVGPRGGFAIGNQCQTSEANIFAIGECAAWSGQLFGLVGPGYQMARVLAQHLAGDSAEFTGADMSTKLKLLGVDVASIGDSIGRTPGALTYALSDGAAQSYKRLVVSADGQKLLGAVLIGDVAQYSYLQQLCADAADLPDCPESLLLPDPDAEAGGIVELLGDSAQVCSCHNVSKGQICAAVSEGATTLSDLKAGTKAATGCGGCAQLATQILHGELERIGVAVDRSLCEHFSFTRQELYHLVRVNEIRSFDELLSKHGQGHGCDICKPAVASILASCWNDYVLDDKRTPLQDTNDHFLANMQKNGTYSVVPRIAGGEITPDKLIALGTVAKKYDLYTKITGGQRIDLFGAAVDQLPAIWSELIAAGFETGHAYGKSVRTVKSCVGSTWCRYGVLDSVAMALRIEHRYKGLRAPHKLKFAVSGCTRECAEAQSKDVGVIATESGWNLYVCGNGGMRPRHADLFLTDLDDDSLIRTIDRFLMFYIRTADRLQRTSVWMENLEGGLEYLREVICEDSLGLADQLEQEMARVVASYECEWKRTINDPASLKRFRSFVNTDTPDPTLQFVRERDQRRPATVAEIEQAKPTEAAEKNPALAVVIK
ncbi:MAG: nitrite reductase large subunit NirB [Pseudomonadota bacterium]